MGKRLLDLFCGAGGAAMGYHRAGFEVVGVDIKLQPHYPFEFHQGDAMCWPLEGFDVIHASPPCQLYSVSTKGMQRRGKEYPDLLPVIRARLQASSSRWVIENVPGSPMWQGVMLCGSMFGLQVTRHRVFDSSEWLYPPCPCKHTGESYTVIGHTTYPSNHKFGEHAAHVGVAIGRKAMGIEWMSQASLSQAIPPAYTEWIGRQLLRIL